MNPTSALSSLQNSNPLLAILWAGFTCGTLDISERRARRPPVFRTPADAVAARDRRRRAGLALVPRRASNGVARPFLSFFHRIFCRHRLPYGEPLDTFPSGARRNLWCFYGVAVYFFMNRVVVPLSGAIKYPFSLQLLVIGVVIHIFCVGLPIALVVRRCSMQ